MQEELRIWKQKYALLQAQVEKEEKIREDQEGQIKKIKEENQQIKMKIEQTQPKEDPKAQKIQEALRQQ